MNAKDLLFFNKEGYPINCKWNEELQYWNSTLFFDKNSTDTYKSLGIYTFEKIQPTRNTFQAYLDQYQVFNTDGLGIWPKNSNSSPIVITDIKKSNNSALFFTKWIYGNNIGNNFNSGDWLYIDGLNGYHNTDFDTLISSNHQIFQVLISQSDRILIKTSTANNIALPLFVPSSTKVINSINIIEVDKTDISFPTYYSNKVYKDKKISYVPELNSDNTGVWTIQDTTITKSRNIITYGPTLFTPTAVPNLPDSIKLKIDFFTDRFQVSNGSTQFAPGLDTSKIQLPYVPFYLTIGDQLIAEQKVTALFGPNSSTFTITNIDVVNNIISITPPCTSQLVDCYMYRASNELVITQDVVLDNNNQYSLPVTYWTIVQNWKTILEQYGININYNTLTDSLELKSLYCDIYFNSTIEKTLSPSLASAVPVVYTGVTSIIPVYPHWIKEQLHTRELINADSTVYSRKLIFNSIDNNGLNIVINGKLYDVDYDLTVSNTTSDWISQYATELNKLGITVTLSNTLIPNDTINIVSQYANRKVITVLRMGDFSIYEVPQYSYTFKNIKSQLLITINGLNYTVPFNIDDNTTVTNWYTKYNAILKSLGILISNPSLGNIIFSSKDPEANIVITYNIGYLPKSGDDSVIIIDLSPNSKGSLIAGNEIKTTTGLYNFLDVYSAGQKININGASKSLMNQSYNIIDLKDDTIWLSYQGPFWQEGLPLFNLDINSDYWIRFPKNGSELHDAKSKIRWTWKDTQLDEIFFYDLSGTQLKPVNPNFPPYSGVIPLCGTEGEIEIKLNNKPNDKLECIDIPNKQQTVFDLLEFDLPYLDEAVNPNIEPSPMSTFVGYQQKLDTFAKSRCYVELLEDITYSLTTDNFSNDLWVIKNNSIEITNVTGSVNFLNLGFKAEQLIELTSKDINIDQRNLATLSNHGRILRIKSVNIHKLEFYETNLIEETSKKTIGKTTQPFYDNSGNQYFEDRYLQVNLLVKPKLLAYFDFYGESEGEDERHAINLNNRNLNLLKLQDFFIFKEVDIKEGGIDWILLNRKRKELLEIYSEIFNNVSSYKSIIQAINFFGYNDLQFLEYFQNINPDSKKFGQLFNMELLNIFDKSVPGWSYSNLGLDNLKNAGYKKTNLFSLNYRITDSEGNFIDGYSQEEVQIKLNGLKKWLTENLIPIGAKIIDINGKYQMPLTYNIKHETYKTQNHRVEEYSYPIDYDVQGYAQPISSNIDQFDITVKPKCVINTGLWYSWKVRTFSTPQWLTTYSYLINDVVYHNGLFYKAINNIAINEEPGISTNWVITNIDKLQYSQIITGTRADLTPWSFTVNKLMDPHFVIEVDWHSGRSATLNNKKVYSVIPNFFDKLKV